MKHRLLITGLILYLSFFSGIEKLQAQTARDYYDQAYELQKQKKYDKAIELLDKAIKLNPDYMIAYQTRGNAFFALREYELAFDDYCDAIDIEPQNAVNFFNRGNTYNALKMYDSAIADFTQAVTLRPDYAYVYWARGLAYSNFKDRNKAFEDYNRAIILDPKLLDAYNSRGLNYLFRGNYEAALNDFKKAIELDVNKAKPFTIINIIEPLARLYRFSEAATYYNDFRSNYTNAGYIDSKEWLFFKKYVEAVTQNLSRDDYQGALKSLLEAEKLYSARSKAVSDDFQARGFSSILALKGYVFERLSNIDDATHAYEQTLVINPNQPDIAASLKRLSKKTEALVQDDKTAPQINILEPMVNKRSISVEDDKVASASQRIRGQAIDKSGIRSILLNNRLLKVEENGYFDTVVNVNEGVNVFTIVATDNNANASSENVQIVTGKTTAAAVAVSASQPDLKVLTTNPVYHAILIAENDYADKNIPSLQAPVADMYKIYNLLLKNYTFTPENTDTLVNATRASILESLIKKANAMNENDNLFIFYAGHGQMITQPDKTEEGFLVPQDAVKDKLSSYISSDDLLRTIKYSKAKHILFVADACFAGTLFRDISAEAPMPVADAYKDKSRKLLASGNRTAVPDKSEFIEYLRLALQENRERYITAEQLIDSFKNQYKNNTHLQLQYFPIKNVEDLGGQFVFKRK